MTEWVLSIAIADSDGGEVRVNYGYDSVDKLLDFPPECGSRMIRVLAKMYCESIAPDAPTEPKP